MAICNYFLRNQCKYGDSCKNEHPGRDSNRGFGGGGRGGGGFGRGSNNNRFAGFSGDSYRPAQQPASAFARNNAASRFSLEKAEIEADLTSQRPTYPLSCYGPGRDAPRQLIEGLVEISPEELRSRYYLARASGTEAAAQQEEAQLHAKMEDQVKNIRNDINGAIKYIQDGADIHPNRLDIAQGKTLAPTSAPSGPASGNPFQQAKLNAFGAAPQASVQNTTFGQTSAPAFGKPAFGQPSNPGQITAAFGQPSNPGQTTAAFGQPSNPGQTTAAFGQPSNPGQATAAFGQTSAPGFGKPSMPGTAFGQASALGRPNPFGQTSAPGSTTAFGQPSKPGQTSTFSQPNALGQNGAAGKPTFGQGAFSQASQPGANTSPFGGQQAQTSNANPFAQALQKPSALGQHAQNSNPFGQTTSQQTQNASSSPFGSNQQSQQSTTSNVFGSNTQPQQAQNPNSNFFGGAAASQLSGLTQVAPSPSLTQSQAPQTLGSNPFGLKTTTNAAATPSFLTAASQPSNTLGQPQAISVATQQSQPAAAAPATTFEPKDRLKEGRPEEYEGERGKVLEEIYRRVARTGFFEDDEDIPLTPPKCEWITPAF
ncbi:hypothetical protein CC80DRAFT_61039 [Byssothecium circinans]|uniref:C3H1-type domain-containing protein n=1 Tax=Byssothecium circinans TaxID=147558 RepID=A0A6A5TVE1_9PLEO|nr:hypothetical protein CC80DRAFT_61039 [Byssothecium circinans]